MESQENFSLNDARNFWRSLTIQPSNKEYQDYIKDNPLMENLFSMGPAFIIIYDYYRERYAYVSKSIMNVCGYTPEQMDEVGFGFFTERLHPDDKQAVLAAEKYYFESILSLPHEERKFLKSSFDYRLRNNHGSYVRLLQQKAVLDLDDAGNPVLIMGIFSDVGQIKKDDQVKVSVVLHSVGGDIKDMSPVAIPSHVLSKRECEVLKLMLEGKSSKMIADELFISINTVNNHRKNMLERTHSNNMAELAGYGLKHGII